MIKSLIIKNFKLNDSFGEKIAANSKNNLPKIFIEMPHLTS